MFNKEDIKNIAVLFEIFYQGINTSKKLKKELQKEFNQTFKKIEFLKNYNIIQKEKRSKKNEKHNKHNN